MNYQVSSCKGSPVAGDLVWNRAFEFSLNHQSGHGRGGLTVLNFLFACASLSTFLPVSCCPAPPVQAVDFEAALQGIRPSVSSALIERLRRWNAEFGST